MPRNSKKNIENFVSWFYEMIRNENVPYENLEDLNNKPANVSFLCYDHFKCNLSNQKYFDMAQNLILERLNEINDINYINELTDIHNDAKHYCLSRRLKANDELDNIWDDTVELLTLSQRLEEYFNECNKNKLHGIPCIYDDLKNRTFKRARFGTRGCDLGWLEWKKNSIKRTEKVKLI